MRLIGMPAVAVRTLLWLAVAGCQAPGTQTRRAPSAAPPVAALLDFSDTIAKVTRVLVDGKPANAWIDDHVLQVSAIGFKTVEITFERDGRTDRSVRHIGFARGVEIKLQDHNGAIIVAQPPGKRCGRVEGSNERWVLCDGVDRRLPVAETFELHCANPSDQGKDHVFWIDSAERPDSPVFVPTLPGLYRARYQRGRISVSYEPSDCAGARVLEL